MTLSTAERAEARLRKNARMRKWRAKPENKAKVAKANKEYLGKPENKAWKKAWQKAYMKEYLGKPENKERNKARQKKWRYGITPAQFDAMLANQGGVCAICHKSELHKDLAVDHDHDTGEVRQLLCHRCNTSLGGFDDYPELVTAAAVYLFSHRFHKPMTLILKDKLDAISANSSNDYDYDYDDAHCDCDYAS